MQLFDMTWQWPLLPISIVVDAGSST